MKKFTKVLAVLMICVLSFSLSVTAFASETKNEIMSVRDLEILSVVLEDYVEEYPYSTEAEQDEFLQAFIVHGGLENNITTYSVGDYLPGIKDLNSKERDLASKHPVQAVKVYNASKSATNHTLEVYGYNGWQDNCDAFRHCLWNALMTKSMDASAAKEWATAHEAESGGIDKQMDLYNNTIGRSIDVSYKSESEIVSEVKSKVKNGNCIRIINNALYPTNGDGML